MAAQRAVWLAFVLILYMTVPASLHLTSIHSWHSHTSHHTIGSGHSSHSGMSSGHSSSETSSNSCHACNCDLYRIIRDLSETQDCISENKVYPVLKALNEQSHYCRKNVIDHLAHTFSGMTTTPSYCHCSGHNTFHDYHSIFGDNPFGCYPDEHFDHLYNRFFKHFGNPHSPPACRSHHAMWAELKSVHNSGCQGMIVDHVGDLFNDDRMSCTCTKAAPLQSNATSKPQQQPTTTTQPVQHTATTAKQTSSVKYHCGKLSTVEGIVLDQHLEKQSAIPCQPGNRNGSDEAFVLINCNTPHPTMWKQGIHVLQHCKDIPTYTPVATFIGGTYHPSLAESGVFMGCIDDGFKLGVQHCNATPTIDHVLKSSSGLQNAEHYYVIA